MLSGFTLDPRIKILGILLLAAIFTAIGFFIGSFFSSENTIPLSHEKMQSDQNGEKFQLFSPVSVFSSSNGILIADQEAHRIVRVDDNGKINLIIRGQVSSPGILNQIGGI